MMRRFLVATTTFVAALLVVGASPAPAQDEPPQQPKLPRELKTFSVPGPSGVWEFRDIDLGSGITECPQARMNVEPDSLRRTARDEVEKLSDKGDDHRANTEYSCFPQNETSIDVNPLAKKNLVAGANDYRLGWASSGFYASTDGGYNWYDGWIPFPSLPNGENLDGGGDPAIAFDRAGVVYYSDINFNRDDDTNGIWVSRSTNGGFTWSRPCVPILGATRPTTSHVRRARRSTPTRRRHGGLPRWRTSPRLPVGNVGELQRDLQRQGVPHDRAAPRRRRCRSASGPRRRRRFPPASPAVRPRSSAPDRVYVDLDAVHEPGRDARLHHRLEDRQLSYSDDMGRSWSPEQDDQRQRRRSAPARSQAERRVTTTSSRCRR